ncbi:hypothetical protein SAMN05421819_2921 [Bryocella elongata]|uniref:Uncharacterized protein n=1 Tax=Bryocella elongata TaxID=863522 RepID=A0A1H6A560_9BACT|nr:hypothetical protein [Bryocella elongata]SEG43561.1 hypothetical protein SAMN05421819_2921 [Bryocella elongata]
MSGDPARAGWISAPIGNLAPRFRGAVIALATLAGSGYAAWKELHYRSPFYMADIWSYLSIARGNAAGLVQPFASRQLGPLIVRGLDALLHIDAHRGFEIEATASLLVLVGVLFALAGRSRAPWWVLVAIAVAPMMPDTMLGMVLPDLFYAALLAIFLILLERELWVAAALWMLPLMVARESTSLTLACLLLAAWRPLRLRGCLLAIASAAGGAGIVHYLSRSSPGNPQHLPESVYILLKVPWNTAQNLFGVELWNNINYGCGTPVWQHAFHLGSIHSVGFCGFNPALPRITLMAGLTEFGLLPLLAAFVLWRRRSRPAAPEARTEGYATMLRFATIYGTAYFLLGPLLGTGVPRLMGYAWPLFFVVLPSWIGESGQSSWVRSRRAIWAVPLFLAIHWAISWVYWQEVYLPEILLGWAVAAVLLTFWSRAETPAPGDDAASRSKALPADAPAGA